MVKTGAKPGSDNKGAGMKKAIDEMYLEYARKLYAEWKAADFKGSFDDNYLPTEKDVMLNFAEWIVREKIKPVITIDIVPHERQQ